MADRKVYHASSTGVVTRRVYHASSSGGVATRKVYHAGAAGEPQQHHSHGIGGFFSNLASGAEAAARGFGPGLATFGKDLAYDTVLGNTGLLAGDWRHSRTMKDVVAPIGHQYAKTYGPLFHGHFSQFGHNLYNDPFGPILDVATLATGGAGAAARAGGAFSKLADLGETSRLARLGEARPIRVSTPASRLGQGEHLTVKMSSENPLIRARQMAFNRAMNRLPASTPGVGADARFARSVSRTAARGGHALALKGLPFKQAFARLSKNERVVWHLHMRAVEPEAWKNLLEAGAIDNPAGSEAALIKRLDEPKVNKLYQTGNKRITAALHEGRDLSDLMTDEKVRRGMLDEQTAAEAPYAALRQVNDAEFVGKKAADRTLPSKRLVRTRGEVAAAQKAYDQAQEKLQSSGFTRDQQKLIAASEKLPSGPPEIVNVARTPAEASTRLEKLQKIYDEFIDNFTGPREGKGKVKLTKDELAEQKQINTDNGRFRKQQSGKTKNGKASGASGSKVPRLQPNVAEASRLEAERAAHEIALKHPDLPAAQKFLALSNEIDDLRANLGIHQEESFLGGKSEANLGTKQVSKPGPRETPFPLPSGKMITAKGAMLAPKGAAKVENLGAALSLQKTRLEQLERGYANRLERIGGAKSRGITDKPGREIHVLAQELADRGRMQPAYVPNSMDTGRVSGAFSRKPGIGPPAKLGSASQNRGILFGSGRINLHGDSLSAEFGRFARHIMRGDINAALIEHAAKAPAELPKGWRFILQKGEEGASFTEKNAADLREALASGESRERLLDRFTTDKADHPDIAHDGEGHRLMVPDGVANALTLGSSSEGNIVRSILFQHPTSLWKHLVLGLRPAYMANIILSQHILGLLQMAPDGRGIAAYFNHLIPGARLGKLTDHTVEDVFPEQAHGSFAASVGGHSTKGARVASKLYEGVMPATLKVENWLRRLMLEGWAAGTPEVRAAMARNGGDINEALRDVAKSDPHVIDEISLKVDHAQGNYRTYSPAEQKLRNVIPFYGWDRHIVQSTYRILAEHPGHALIASRLGAQGHAINERDFGALPTYLQDLVKFSPLESIFGKAEGRATGVSTKAIGPFTSDVDLAETIWSAVHGRAGTHTEEASNINPLLAGLYEQLTGRSLLTGAPLKDKLNHGAFNIPARIALQTPQARLLESLLKRHPLGQPKRAPAAQVSLPLLTAGYLGLPVKRLDLAHEHKIAALQHTPPK